MDIKYIQSTRKQPNQSPYDENTINLKGKK